MSLAFHESPPSGPCADMAARFQALIPEIETARLILRAPRIEDFQPFAETVLSQRGRFFGHHDNRDSAWYDFIQLSVTWMLRGHGAWTITDRASGAVLGFVHIGAEPGDREYELGYVVTAEAEGGGIAYEAASATRDFAFTTLGLDSLVSYIDPANSRSAALALRLGAARDLAAETALGADPSHVYRHPAPEGTQ